MFNYNNTNKPTTWNTKGTILALTCIWITMIISVGSCAYLYTKEHEVIINNNTFQIKVFLHGTHVKFSDIIEISLLNQNVIEIGGTGLRTGAYVSSNRATGNFQKGFFCVYINNSPTIRITRRNTKPIYINFRSSTKTEQLYSLLKGAFLQFKGTELSEYNIYGYALIP